MYKQVPINYETLHPYIDRQTIKIHYNKHYLNYLNKLNELLNSQNYDYRYSKEELVKHIDIFDLNKRADILYNLGAVLNHELYFTNMSNNKNTYPTGSLLTKIEKEYGTYDNFKNEFIQTANNLKGSGYTFLCIDRNNHLLIISTSNQDTPYSYNLIPIMALDLWEHAYYLQYKNDRASYINNFFNIIDYKKVSENLDNI